jgi:hypothetical protein
MLPNSRLLAAVVLAVLVVLTGTAVFAQTGQFAGQVTDPQKAVVPNAEVRIVNQATGIERKAKTSEAGLFTVPYLQPGQYRVYVQASGFETSASQEITLNVGQAAVVNFELKVGSTQQVVTVESGAPLVNTQDASVSTVVDRRFVGNLPLNGRTFQSLITLSAGTVLIPASGSTQGDQGQFSVNGQRGDANYFTVDGVSANIGVVASGTLGQAGSGAITGYNASGGMNGVVSVDALEEFRIQTSTYAPEFGRSPGAQIQVLTRSGTNDIHGTVFDYLRNDMFDANNWFANHNGNPKPKERQNDFGGVLGGPIMKNRTFFFFSYEGLRLRQPVSSTTQVPSRSARQAAPAGMQPYLNVFPMPTGPDQPNNTAILAASYSNPANLDAVSLRVDHTVSNKVALFARFNHSPSSIALRGGGSTALSVISTTSVNIDTATVGATFNISPRINNEARANYSKTEGATFNRLDSFGGAIPLSASAMFPASAPASKSQFLLSLVGLTQGTLNVGKIADNYTRQVNIVDNLSLVVGAHQIKVGVDYRRMFPIFSRSAYSDLASFAGVTGALTGKATLASITADAGSRYPLFPNLSLYAQDTWRVVPRLTVTYGIRWEFNPPPTEEKGHTPLVVSGLANPSTATLAPKGAPLWQTSYNNFAPRIGVAYKIFPGAERETVLRSGFGVFYDLGTSDAAEAFSNYPPYIAFNVLPNVAYPLTPAALTPPPLVLTLPVGPGFAFDPHLKLPLTYQWNATLEQGLSKSETLSLSYVGAAGRRLLRRGMISTPSNPVLSSVEEIKNSATSDYDALQARYNRHLSHGLQVLASYTWSHALDIASNDTAYNVSSVLVSPNIDRASSDFDVRHELTGAVTYDFPSPVKAHVLGYVLRDWAIDSVVTARSATPVNVIAGVDTLGSGQSTISRPDLLPGIPLYLQDSTVAGGRRINRAAFVAPPKGRQGTLSRNALRGFPLSQVDLAVRRNFALTERVHLQYRAELFNIFNHPNFANPLNNIQSSLFGTSTSTLAQSLGAGGITGGLNPLYQVGGPRSVQFALKLMF